METADEATQNITLHKVEAIQLQENIPFEALPLKDITETCVRYITGNTAVVSEPLRGQDYLKYLHEQIKGQLIGHINFLAAQQGTQCKEVPHLEPNATAEQELAYIRAVVNNIFLVQGKNNAGITPYLSRQVGGMDCSMCTWVLQHELTKANIQCEWVAPIGHAAGLITLKNGETFYADGQNGFVEKVEVQVVEQTYKLRVLKVINSRNIQESRGEFFPEYLFIHEHGGVLVMLSNMNSMLYSQYTDELTEEIKEQLGEEDSKIVKQLLPYARDFKNKLGPKDIQVLQSDKTPINMIINALAPEMKDLRRSEPYVLEQDRLNHFQGINKGKIVPIFTHIETSPLSNTENDCGIIVLKMLLHADGKQNIADLEIDEFRARLNKLSGEGIMPGFICRFLEESGYRVRYHTAIDWNKCAIEPKADLSNWDEKVKNLPSEVWRGGFIKKHKLRESAQYLSQHPSLLNRQPISIADMAHALAEDNRVIALVGTDHYVLITGIDNDYVYYNNPKFNDNTRQEQLPHHEFIRWMEGLVNNGEHKSNLAWNEVIIAQKKD